MTINLTKEKISKIKKLYEKTMNDEFYGKKDIMESCYSRGELLQILEAQEQRLGATSLLNALGIGVDFDFENRTVELWDMKTDEVIA